MTSTTRPHKRAGAKPPRASLCICPGQVAAEHVTLLPISRGGMIVDRVRCAVEGCGRTWRRVAPGARDD